MKNIETFDEWGRQQGYYETYHDNGQLHETGTKINSIHEGQCVEYWPNGQLRCDLLYVNGNITGRYIEYHKDGSLWVYAFMDKDEREIGYTYLTKEDIADIKERYKNGEKLNSIANIYNRKFRSISDIVNGITYKDDFWDNLGFTSERVIMYKNKK